MSLKATKKGTDFEMAPSGPQPARCYRIVDLGTQEVEWQGTKKQQAKVLITFELLGDERMADGRPFSISQRYTASMHEKSVLSQHLQSWRGRPFTPEERTTFDLSKLLGVYALLNVVHAVGKEGTEYANIGALMPLPKSMGKPEAVNPPVLFDLDHPDLKIMETFGERLQETIKASAEWKAMKGGSSAATFADMPDDVPWEETKEAVKEYDF